MSTLVEESGKEANPDHSILRYCVPMVDPSTSRSLLSFHCNQYEPFSKVRESRFKIDVTYYQKGRKISEYHGPEVPSTEILEYDFSEPFQRDPTPTLAIVDLLRPHDQGGIDPYVSHQHMQTGVYVSHPMILFMGDDNLDTYLSAAFDNSLFWAGLVVEDEHESCAFVLNPYNTSMGYQMFVYGEGGTQHVSPVKRLPPRTFDLVVIEEIYPDLKKLRGTNRGFDYSFCISTQYSSKALFGVRHRKDKYYTTLDHLHEYIFR